MFGYGAYEPITVTVSDGITEITFSHLEKHNSLDTATMLDLQRVHQVLARPVY